MNYCSPFIKSGTTLELNLNTVSHIRSTILFFDSGIGGLSIYKEVQKLIPNIRYIYVFDNKNFPYGEKNEEFIKKYTLKIVKTIANRFHLTLVVIACNSASVVSLPILRKQFTFPIVGVVPAIKSAACLTRNGIIGLLATRNTIYRPYIHKLIKRFARNKCKTLMLGSIKLVELAEAKLRGEKVLLSDIKNTLEPWLNMQERPDTVVLGCTHFPLLRKEIQNILSDKIKLIDSGVAVARHVTYLLTHKELHKAITSRHNIAFCTNIDRKVTLLIPILKHYGFSSLEKLVI
ncbi:glutamate racemase [Pantoea sp. Aalb]|uniref:glutamate racemase n=1 Tax=Pantoea sp. Aalb TaxID=2576762 RepID=UPI00132ACCA8|nr:glutamate racemase [Pantoea sp. Aalb]MXP67913.1 glutamate racemase [Pantoea sp. Aalb]